MVIDRVSEQRAWSNLTPKVKRGIIELKENASIRDGRIYDRKGNDRTHHAELVAKTTENQVRALRGIDDLSTHEVENGGFVFAFFESCKAMEDRFPSLTQSDMARLMFIGTYTGYDTGRLQHDNGRVIDKKKLEQLVNISERKFRDFYKKLLAEGILSEESGGLYMNPSVFYRGSIGKSQYQLKEYQHTRLFRKTVRDLYEKYNGRTIKQLAIIYGVLPFLNFNTNIVCFNPEESNEDELRPMDLGKLAALLHYKDVAKFKRSLESIKLDDKPVFLLPPNAHDKRKRNIIVNPRVVVAGSAQSLNAIKALFN